MTVPARVFAIVARDGKTATVFRRGPSKLTQLLLWDLKTDLIREGQWLRRAVYPRRCDLSPDGQHMIYFAASHKGSDDANFTAISRPPFWTALHFYGQSDAWNGGGVFLDNKTYWPDLGFGSSVTKKAPCGLARANKKPRLILDGMGEDKVIYFPRLQRDGWSLDAKENKPGRYSGTTIWSFSRKVREGWTLRKTFNASLDQRGPHGEVYWETHHLSGPSQTVSLNDEWAEVDKGSVIYAAQGELLRVKFADNVPGIASRIANLNPNRFASIKAPYEGLRRSRS